MPITGFSDMCLLVCIAQEVRPLCAASPTSSFPLRKARELKDFEVGGKTLAPEKLVQPISRMWMKGLLASCKHLPVGFMASPIVGVHRQKMQTGLPIMKQPKGKSCQVESPTPISPLPSP